MTPIIQTENLTHVYGGGTPFQMTAIHDINFAAYPGEFIGIVGHTGSGKSTFIQHLNGILKPTSGKVLFKGQDIYASRDFTRQVRFKVGLVFQYPEYQLFEETVYKDIAFGPKNMKLSEKEIDERVREAAGFVGLEESALDKSPFDLSGGQKRRVAIAGVIAMRPEVLVLDEPTAGLDPEGCESIISNIRAYHKAMGSTILMITHSMEDAARHADRMLVLSGGTIAMSGAPREVFSHEKQLLDMGLDLPQVTRVMLRLREMGIDADPAVYTIEQAVRALTALKEGKEHA